LRRTGIHHRVGLGTTERHERVPIRIQALVERQRCGAFRGMLRRVGTRVGDAMPTAQTMSAAKSYDEIIDFIAAGTTPEALVAFRPSDSVQLRVAELVERSKDGCISSEEQSELEDYLQLEHIMIMAKARARQHTQLGN